VEVAVRLGEPEEDSEDLRYLRLLSTSTECSVTAEPSPEPATQGVSIWGFDEGIAWEAFFVYAEFVEFLESLYDQ
jgi:hypothetical protein